MDRRPRQNHRRRQTRAPSVRFDPLGNGLFPFCLTPFNGAVYFNGQNADQSRDLWSSDATTANTVGLTASAYYPLFPAAAFGKLFFNGTLSNPDGSQFTGLMSYDAVDGPVVIPNPTGVASFNPYCLAALAAGTAPYYFGRIDPIFGGSPSASPPALPVSLFMGGTGGGGNPGLFKYDGDGAPPALIDPTTYGLNPYNPVALQWMSTVEIPFHVPGFEFKDLLLLYYNSAVFFSGIDGVSDGNTLRGLWMSQGSAATTRKLQGWFVSGLSLDPYNLTPLNGILYFTGNDALPAGPRGLFSYNPVTKATTHLFSSAEFNFSPNDYNSTWNGSPIDLNPLAGPLGNGSPFTMIAFNNKLYFNCTANGQQGLYVWDPTKGTGVKPSLVTGTGGSDPFCLTTADFQ